MHNGDGKEHVGEATRAAQEKMKRMFDDLTAKSLEFFTEGIENARGVFEEQSAALKQKAEEYGLDEVPGEIQAYIRRKPWQSVAIAAGLGVALGLMLRSGPTKALEEEQ